MGQQKCAAKDKTETGATTYQSNGLPSIRHLLQSRILRSPSKDDMRAGRTRWKPTEHTRLTHLVSGDEKRVLLATRWCSSNDGLSRAPIAEMLNSVTCHHGKEGEDDEENLHLACRFSCFVNFDATPHLCEPRPRLNRGLPQRCQPVRTPTGVSKWERGKHNWTSSFQAAPNRTDWKELQRISPIITLFTPQWSDLLRRPVVMNDRRTWYHHGDERMNL